MPRGIVTDRTLKELAENGECLTDEARLRQLGYKQELRRELSLLKNFAVSFGLLSMLTGLGGFYSYGFEYGGPVVIVWGWVLVVCMTLTVALMMAEICSSLPTSGGVYYWSAVLAGKHGPIMSWLAGWYNLLGQVGITAGVEYTVVRYLEQVISIAKVESYAFTPKQFFGVYCGVAVFHGVLNAISVKLLGLLSLVSVWWHILGTLTIVIGLPIVAVVRQPASYVFGHFNPNPDSGIDNRFYIFILGLLLSQWAMCGYDSSAHVAEETKNAAVAGPVGLLMAIGGSFICGWMFLLSLTFCIQDPNNLGNPELPTGGYVTSQIFWDAFAARTGNGQNALGFMLILFVASNFCGTFCITANSRMLYAFARDNGVPGSRWWKKVNNSTGTPINSIIGMVLAACALGTTLLGSTVAFTAISSIGIIGLYISYVIPILLRLTYARKMFKKGPFHLGRLSYVIGWMGVGWTSFITVIFVLPTAYPVTLNNLNYASVAVIAVFVFSMAWWVVDARRWFKGPVRNVDENCKTRELCEAYEAGELDETDDQFGNEKAEITEKEEEQADYGKAQY